MAGWQGWHRLRLAKPGNAPKKPFLFWHKLLFGVRSGTSARCVPCVASVPLAWAPRMRDAGAGKGGPPQSRTRAHPSHESRCLVHEGSDGQRQHPPRSPGSPSLPAQATLIAALAGRLAAHDASLRAGGRSGGDSSTSQGHQHHRGRARWARGRIPRAAGPKDCGSAPARRGERRRAG